MIKIKDYIKYKEVQSITILSVRVGMMQAGNELTMGTDVWRLNYDS